MDAQATTTAASVLDKLALLAGAPGAAPQPTQAAANEAPPADDAEPIFIECEQPSEEWHLHRVGLTTASTFRDAVDTVGGLDERQQLYVDALKAGKAEADALALAGYKKKPSAASVEKALAGEPVGEPSDKSIKLAVGSAIELISGKPFGDTFETWAMKHGREQEAFARLRYEAVTGFMAQEAGIVLTPCREYGYSTDGFVGDDRKDGPGAIEIKCLRDPAKIMAILETGDLSEFMHQMQGGLWITRLRWIDFVLYVPELRVIDRDIYIKRVYRDEAFIAKLRADLAEHRRRVHHFERVLRSLPQVSATEPDLLAA